MSTLAEIEEAIGRLSPVEVGALVAWLEKHRAGLPSSSFPVRADQDKPFMKLAGTLVGPANLSQRRSFSAK